MTAYTHSYIKHSLINMIEYGKLIRLSYFVYPLHSIYIFPHFLLDIMNQQKIEGLKAKVRPRRGGLESFHSAGNVLKYFLHQARDIRYIHRIWPIIILLEKLSRCMG